MSGKNAATPAEKHREPARTTTDLRNQNPLSPHPPQNRDMGWHDRRTGTRQGKAWSDRREAGKRFYSAEQEGCFFLSSGRDLTVTLRSSETASS